MQIKLIQYENDKRNPATSGAYTFMPEEPAVDFNRGQLKWIRVEQGPLRSRVCVNMEIFMHCVEIFPTVNKHKKLKYPLIHVWNVVDLRKTHNYELAMLVQSDIQNKDIIHSDLNGFQYIKRKRHEKLTLQGNVYPMPSGAFIQDSKLRFSVLTAQALGVASLENSHIQVFLDRHLDQDDNLGLSEPINDNIVFSSRFVLFFEKVKRDLDSVASDFPSLMHSWLSNELLYPVVKLLHTNSDHETVNEMSFSSKKYPCDLHLVNMRTMQTESEEPKKNEVGLMLHRMVYDDCPNSFLHLSSFFYYECKFSNKYQFEDFFAFVGYQTSSLVVKSTLLTLNNYTSTLINKYDDIISRLEPMHINAFLVNF
jgi:alpha-mannosidase II